MKKKLVIEPNFDELIYGLDCTDMHNDIKAAKEFFENGVHYDYIEIKIQRFANKKITALYKNVFEKLENHHFDQLIINNFEVYLSFWGSDYHDLVMYHIQKYIKRRPGNDFTMEFIDFLVPEFKYSRNEIYNIEKFMNSFYGYEKIIQRRRNG